MTTITLDIDQFTKALADTTNRTLGWVYLQPFTAQTNENTRPSYVPTPPYVMSSFVLVNSDSYRFEYNAVRYGRFCYLLERNGVYEAGELAVIHYLPVVVASPANEPSRPSIPATFVPPTITTSQVCSLGSIGSLGVSFSFIHDVATDGSIEKFGLAYKITNASPAVYPRLILSYITAFSMEDV